MNDDVLERLLMDHALNALSPDAETLLADYLAHCPRAAREAEELRDLVVLSAKALRRENHPAEIPDNLMGVFSRFRSQRWLAMAASFVVGAVFAVLLLQANPAHKPASRLRLVQERPRPAEAVPRPATADAAISSLPFWSNQRAYLLATSLRKPQSTHRP